MAGNRIADILSIFGDYSLFREIRGAYSIVEMPSGDASRLPYLLCGT